jgi:hypothetical protein
MLSPKSAEACLSEFSKKALTQADLEFLLLKVSRGQILFGEFINVFKETSEEIQQEFIALSSLVKDVVSYRVEDQKDFIVGVFLACRSDEVKQSFLSSVIEIGRFDSIFAVLRTSGDNDFIFLDIARHLRDWYQAESHRLETFYLKSLGEFVLILRNKGEMMADQQAGGASKRGMSGLLKMIVDIFSELNSLLAFAQFRLLIDSLKRLQISQPKSVFLDYSLGVQSKLDLKLSELSNVLKLKPESNPELSSLHTSLLSMRSELGSLIKSSQEDLTQTCRELGRSPSHLFHIKVGVTSVKHVLSKATHQKIVGLGEHKLSH